MSSTPARDKALIAKKIEQLRQRPTEELSARELAFIYKNAEPTHEETSRLRTLVAAKKKTESEVAEVEPAAPVQNVDTEPIQQNEAAVAVQDYDISFVHVKEHAPEPPAPEPQDDIYAFDVDADILVEPPEPDIHQKMRSRDDEEEPSLPTRPKIADLSIESQDEFYRATNEYRAKATRSEGKKYHYSDDELTASTKVDLPAGEVTKRGIAAKIGTIVKNALHEPIFIVAFIILVFIIMFMRPSLVPSGSMIPTLQIGDRILSIAQYFPNGHTYSRGDVACFYNEATGEIYVKRVIGIGGDHIQIAGEKVYVNGEESPYQGTGGVRMSMDVQLDDDEYWMMGDNRGNSLDSRYIGPVKASNMVSKVFAVYFPSTRMKLVDATPYDEQETGDGEPSDEEQRSAGVVTLFIIVAAVLCLVALLIRLYAGVQDKRLAQKTKKARAPSAAVKSKDEGRDIDKNDDKVIDEKEAQYHGG